MTEAEETLRYIIDTLRINYTFSNPNRDKKAREDEVIKKMGKGWCRTNLFYFKQIVEYDINEHNGYYYSLEILKGNTTIGEVLKLVYSNGEYNDLNELESYLYITALCNVNKKQPLDNLRKIGRADDYKKRMRRLSSDLKSYLSGTKSPYGYMPVKLWKGPKPLIIEVEKRLHDEFDHIRDIGEFFDMDIKFFDKIELIVNQYNFKLIETDDVVNDYNILKKNFSVDEIIDIVKNEGKF
jgi:hypothetical protein